MQAIIKIMNWLQAHDSERGATAVEYGLMVSLIAVIIIGTVTALGASVDGAFGAAAGAIN